MTDSEDKQTVDGRYRLNRVIGKGGMGQVYEATHIAIGRNVALKTLHPDATENATVVKRLRLEAQIAGSIGHDHICEVIDTGITAEGTPYLVMPLLKGETLAQLIKNRAPLQIERSIRIAVQILNGLDAAHKNNIVHRDLNPKNVFLTTVAGRCDFVKILDFGISKRLNQPNEDTLTKAGAILGTPVYMSPEQVFSASDIDNRTDIYAAGVLLYEMLTGRRPFKGDSYGAIIARIVSAPYTQPILLNNDISKPLNRIVVKAMSRDPDDRFSSALDMVRALERVTDVDDSSRTATTLETSSREAYLVTQDREDSLYHGFSSDGDADVAVKTMFQLKNRRFVTLVAAGALVVGAGISSYIYVSKAALSNMNPQTPKSETTFEPSPEPPEPSCSPEASVTPTNVSSRSEVATYESAAYSVPLIPPMETPLQSQALPEASTLESSKKNPPAKSSVLNGKVKRENKKKRPSPPSVTMFTGRKNTVFSEDYGD